MKFEFSSTNIRKLLKYQIKKKTTT